MGSQSVINVGFGHAHQWLTIMGKFKDLKTNRNNVPCNQ